jgi:hypothetical protein
MDTLSLRQTLLIPALLLSLFPSGRAAAQPAPAQDCSAISSARDRQRCEEAFSQSVNASSRTAELGGGWRLVRTTNPRGGTDAISIMHVSDTSKSDFGLAGLTLRCGGAGIETLLIVLEPLEAGSHPPVNLQAGPSQGQFEGSAIQGGEALLLPRAVSNLAAGPWQTASELAVEIAIKPVPIRGVVPISGLSTALQTLTRSCVLR